MIKFGKVCKGKTHLLRRSGNDALLHHQLLVRRQQAIDRVRFRETSAGKHSSICGCSATNPRKCHAVSQCPRHHGCHAENDVKSIILADNKRGGCPQNVSPHQRAHPRPVRLNQRADTVINQNTQVTLVSWCVRDARTTCSFHALNHRCTSMCKPRLPLNLMVTAVALPTRTANHPHKHTSRREQARRLAAWEFEGAQDCLRLAVSHAWIEPGKAGATQQTRHAWTANALVMQRNANTSTHHGWI